MDPNRDESFIIELLELKENVADAGSARWFLEDLAVEQAFENTLVRPSFLNNIATGLISRLMFIFDACFHGFDRIYENIRVARLFA